MKKLPYATLNTLRLKKNTSGIHNMRLAVCIKKAT